MTTLTMAFVIAPMTANAQDVNRRLEDQHDRIHQGIRSGELTRREANVVRSDDRYIRNEERFDRATDHGRLTWRERENLDRQLNRNSERIYDFKHNCRER
jgi:hypothetical protein